MAGWRAAVAGLVLASASTSLTHAAASVEATAAERGAVKVHDPVRRTSDERIVIGSPAYFSPGSTWSAALAGVPSVRYLVANPASGPGARSDPAYAALVAESAAAGVRLLGYVSTRWGQRPRDEVLREIRAYRAWYGITGIFLDEAATSAEHLPYYRRLARTVRARPGGLVALNPGTAPDEAYARVGDILVVFEGSYDSYRHWMPPAWQTGYPRSRFWHLVYATPSERAVEVLRTATERRAGVVYVTDDVLDNPWDRLPSYWSRVLAEVRELNR